MAATALPQPVRVPARQNRLQRVLGSLPVLGMRPAHPGAIAVGTTAVEPVELARVGIELVQCPILSAARASLPAVGIPGLPHLLDLLRRPGPPRRRTDSTLHPVARSAD